MLFAVVLEVAKNVKSEEDRILLLVVMSCHKRSFQVKKCSKKYV